MLAYFALSVIETLAIAHLKRVHDNELEALELKAKQTEEDNKRLNEEKEEDYSMMIKSAVEGQFREPLPIRGYLSD